VVQPLRSFRYQSVFVVLKYEDWSLTKSIWTSWVQVCFFVVDVFSRITRWFKRLPLNDNTNLQAFYI